MILLRLALSAISLGLTCGLLHAGELDPAAVAYTLPDKVKWEAISGVPRALDTFDATSTSTGDEPHAA